MNKYLDIHVRDKQMLEILNDSIIGLELQIDINPEQEKQLNVKIKERKNIMYKIVRLSKRATTNKYYDMHIK